MSGFMYTLVCVMLMLFSGPVFGAEEQAGGAGTLVWAFVNSPVGVAIVVAILSAILGVVFKRKPEWQEIFESNRGNFFDAVRHAESAIPDNATNKAAQKTDVALKFLLKLEPGLAKNKTANLKRALTEAHDKLKA